MKSFCVIVDNDIDCNFLNVKSLLKKERIMKRYNVWTLCLVIMGIVCSQAYTGQRVPTTRSAAAGYLTSQIRTTNLSAMTADEYKAWAQNIKQALDVLSGSDKQGFIRSLKNKTNQLDLTTIADLQASGINDPMEVFIAAQPVVSAPSVPSKTITPTIIASATTFEGIIDELKDVYHNKINGLNINQDIKSSAYVALNGIASTWLSSSFNEAIDITNEILGLIVANRFSVPQERLSADSEIYEFIVSLTESVRNKKSMPATRLAIANGINESLKISNAILYYLDKIDKEFRSAAWFVSYDQAKDLQLRKEIAKCMSGYIVPSSLISNCLNDIVNKIVNIPNQEAASIYAKNMIESLKELSQVPRLASYVDSFNKAIGILNNHIAAIERAKESSSSESKWWKSYGEEIAYTDVGIHNRIKALGLNKNNVLDKWQEIIDAIKESFSNDATIAQIRKNLGLGHTVMSSTLNTTPAENRISGVFERLENWKPDSDPIASEVNYIVNDSKKSQEYKLFALYVLDYYASHIANILIALDSDSNGLKDYLNGVIHTTIRGAINSLS